MLLGQDVLAVCAVGSGEGGGWWTAQGVRDAVVVFVLFVFSLKTVEMSFMQFITVVVSVIMQRQFQRLAETAKVPRCSLSRWVTSL